MERALTRLLLIEDDHTIGGVLRDALRRHRYDVVWAVDGQQARRALEQDEFALVLLDLGLPDIDGIDLCRIVRDAQPSTVIVILTARDAELDVVVGLESGADDYLTKPIRTAELLARVRAHLRRTSPATERVSEFGSLKVDGASRRAWIGDRDLHLRAKEFDLLARLAAEPSAALSRATLMVDVWDDHWHGSTKTLDVHIAALRKRLAETAADGDEVPEIVTLRGFGYRLDPPDVRSSSSPNRSQAGAASKSLRDR